MCTVNNLDPHCYASLSISPSSWGAGENFEVSISVGKDFLQSPEPNPSMVSLTINSPQAAGLNLAAVFQTSGQSVSFTEGTLRLHEPEYHPAYQPDCHNEN